MEEVIKQLKIMLECRKKHEEEFKECVTCDKDIQALERVINLLEENKEILEILKEE